MLGHQLVDARLFIVLGHQHFNQTIAIRGACMHPSLSTILQASTTASVCGTHLSHISYPFIKKVKIKGGNKISKNLLYKKKYYFIVARSIMQSV